MIFLNPAKEFYIHSAKYVKNNQLKTINELEADVMILEHNLFNLKDEMIDKSAQKQKISLIMDQVSKLKKVIKDKRNKL